MDASKENCLNARADLIRISDNMPQELRNSLSAQILRLEEFLEAAHKKLPKQESFDRTRLKKKAAANRVNNGN